MKVPHISKNKTDKVSVLKRFKYNGTVLAEKHRALREL